MFSWTAPTALTPKPPSPLFLWMPHTRVSQPSLSATATWKGILKLSKDNLSCSGTIVTAAYCYQIYFLKRGSRNGGKLSGFQLCFLHLPASLHLLSASLTKYRTLKRKREGETVSGILGRMEAAGRWCCCFGLRAHGRMGCSC